jgi:two-component system, NtrC family, response regulator AtoC
MNKILVGEDAADIRNYLKLALNCYGFTVEFAQNGDEVLSLVNQNKYSLLLLDIFMPFRDGLEVLTEVRKVHRDLPVIMMSVAATPTNVVRAMTRGANDFLAKPIGHDELRGSIEKVLGISGIPNSFASSNVLLTQESDEYLACTGTWSQKIAILIERVGSSDVPVLLQGETGVGKEVIARQLHARSRRAGRPFLKLNCAALPSELVESELFGYEKGAFTGAFKSTPGKFEMANGGTILLDEIGDMDFRLQAKLLQVIQDREFIRLGAKDTSRVDVRIMAATHCDFDRAIEEGRFREDLYYRLNIIDIQIPPLRERRDEILPLAEFFIAKYATPESPVLEIGPTLRQVFLDHTWPGNIRELENVMQKYLVLRNPTLLADEIQRRARKGRRGMQRSTVRMISEAATWADSSELIAGRDTLESQVDRLAAQPLDSRDESRRLVPANALPKAAPYVFRAPTSLGSEEEESVLSKVQDAHRAAEAEAIVRALNSCLWNRKQAAVALNIDYKALLYKMKKLGIGERNIASVG